MTPETMEMLRQDAERQVWISHYMLMSSQVVLVVLVVIIVVGFFAGVCWYAFSAITDWISMFKDYQPTPTKPACTLCGQPIEANETHGGATGCLDAYTAKHYSRPN